LFDELLPPMPESSECAEWNEEAEADADEDDEDEELCVSEGRRRGWRGKYDAGLNEAMAACAEKWVKGVCEGEGEGESVCV